MLRAFLSVSAAGALALSGCGAPGDAPVAAAPVLPLAAEVPNDSPNPNPAPGPQPIPQPPAGQPAPKPVEPPTMPKDVGGLAVKKALMPSVAGSPVPPTVKGPRPRSTDLDRGELPLPRALTQAPAQPLPKAKPALPSPPGEKPPVGLGDAAAVGADAFPLADRPLLKAVGPTNPGATDVPAMARPLPDRAPVEDPTVDLSAKGVVVTPFPLPASQLPFLKDAIPNPFELMEQLKGKVGKDTEFGTAPVPVPPEKK